MASEYTIVGYEPKFKEQIVELQRRLWSPEPALNRAYFEWKHERNPYFESPLMQLGLRDGQLVGMRTLFGTCWEIGEGAQPVVLPYADDFLIAPDARNSGLASDLMNGIQELASRSGFPYLVNLSAGPVTALQSLASGWRSAGAMEPVGIEPASGETVARAKDNLRRVPGLRPVARALRLSGRDVASPFEQLDQTAKSGGADELVVEHRPRPAAMAHLLERIGYDGRIRQLRDETYFSWRFQNPLHKYRFLYLEGEELDGYLVLQVRFDGSLVRVVDWEALEPTALRALLRFALAAGGFERISTWEAAQPEEGQGILRELGFGPVERDMRARGQPCLLVRSVASEPGGRDWSVGSHRLLDPESWDLRLLYSMLG